MRFALLESTLVYRQKTPHIMIYVLTFYGLPLDINSMLDGPRWCEVELEDRVLSVHPHQK